MKITITLEEFYDSERRMDCSRIDYVETDDTPPHGHIENRYGLLILLSEVLANDAAREKDAIQSRKSDPRPVDWSAETTDNLVNLLHHNVLGKEGYVHFPGLTASS